MSSEHYVRIAAEQPWTAESALRLIKRARTEAMRLNAHRILFDLRRWDPPTSEMVRFDSGVYVAEMLKPPYRVAALAREENVNYFAENVAINRGAMLKVFTEEAAAVEWLLK